jgi:ATP-binding protein involved in chromosome partitioning
MASEQSLREALKRVKDPEIKKDLVSLGLVKKLTVDGGAVTIGVELTTPACPLRATIEKDVREAVLGLGDVTSVAVDFTAQVASRGAAPDKNRLPSVRNVIAVAAGKGGVGKSTVATNLALALQAHGARVGILDADIYGPSIPQMLGPPEVAASGSGEGKILPAIHYGLKVISVAFFVQDSEAVVWRGPMVHKLLQQFLEEVAWGELDYLVVDLPPGTGDAQLSLSQLIPITGAVMVTTPQQVALIDVVKGIAMFKRVEIPILGVVENMAYYVCPGCGHHDDIFSRGGGKRLADEHGVPLLAEVPIDSKVRYGGDAGKPVLLGAPDSEHARIFMELAAKTACRVSTLVMSGPKRVPGLVAIK